MLPRGAFADIPNGHCLSFQQPEPQLDLAEYEQIQPNAQAEGLTFLLPNQQCAWRVQTLLTKEPDTIAWIRNMEPSKILYDVGANMGQYAMLAAKQGLRVHAFEPEAQNFALLTKNIAANHLTSACTAWPVALSDHASMEILYLSGITAGGSCHAYGKSIDYRGNAKEFAFSQGSIATTMDHFAAKYGNPNYIKIDVDGFEHLVCAGADVCLKHAKSVLIEINTKYPLHMELVERMTNHYGFNYDSAQALESRRKDGPFEGIGNIIFYRD
jgi:FkbM family methyltransferase